MQKRSLKNKTFPYICQATWAGKVELGENIGMAVKRECKEEMGEEFCKNFNFSELILKSKDVYTMKGEKWRANNFIGEVSEDLLKLVKLHNEALPQFIFLNKDELIYPVSSVKNPKNNIILFDDQYKVLKEIIKK
ncbi:MAG: NUDIX domain-containing protein [Patescibacteria group bacterium]